MIKKHLSERGYHPTRFEISRNLGNHDISAYNFPFEVHDSVMELTGPSAISLKYQDIKNTFLHAQEGLCLYLVNIATTSKNSILTIMNDYFKRDISDSDWNNYNSLICHVSHLRCALKNAYNAELLAILFEGMKLPGSSSTHYREISKINRLHQSLAWLKRYTEGAGEK